MKVSLHIDFVSWVIWQPQRSGEGSNTLTTPATTIIASTATVSHFATCAITRPVCDERTDIVPQRNSSFSAAVAPEGGRTRMAVRGRPPSMSHANLVLVRPRESSGSGGVGGGGGGGGGCGGGGGGGGNGRRGGMEGKVDNQIIAKNKEDQDKTVAPKRPYVSINCLHPEYFGLIFGLNFFGHFSNNDIIFMRPHYVNYVRCCPNLLTRRAAIAHSQCCSVRSSSSRQLPRSVARNC